MESIIENFESRVKEVELYFEFIEQTSKVNVCISDLYKNEHKPIKIESDIKKILKANLFLLLYNLIESSFKKTLIKLIEEINGSKSKYGVLIPEIRKIWLEDETKFFSLDAPKVDGKAGKKLDHYYSIIDDIVEHVLSIPKTPSISGNLDGRSIKELSAKYGALSNRINNLKAEKLVKVKSERNALAHGNISFLDCGKDLVITDLKEIKDQVIMFMRVILEEFQIQIERKYYQNGIDKS